jgi:hypothetical protein
MKYQVTVSPIRGQRITKTVDGVRELHAYLMECREMGYDIKRVSRMRRPVVQLAQEPQLA